jgi:hypothetical protein
MVLSALRRLRKSPMTLWTLTLLIVGVIGFPVFAGLFIAELREQRRARLLAKSRGSFLARAGGEAAPRNFSAPSTRIFRP